MLSRESWNNYTYDTLLLTPLEYYSPYHPLLPLVSSHPSASETAYVVQPRCSETAYVVQPRCSETRNGKQCNSPNSLSISPHYSTNCAPDVKHQLLNFHLLVVTTLCCIPYVSLPRFHIYPRRGRNVEKWEE